MHTISQESFRCLGLVELIGDINSSTIWNMGIYLNFVDLTTKQRKGMEETHIGLHNYYIVLKIAIRKI